MKKISLTFEITVNNKLAKKLTKELEKEFEDAGDSFKEDLDSSSNTKTKSVIFKMTTENI